MATYRCNLCPPDTEGGPFRVPAGDPFGAALMRDHLAEHDAGTLPIVDVIAADELDGGS